MTLTVRHQRKAKGCCITCGRKKVGDRVTKLQCQACQDKNVPNKWADLPMRQTWIIPCYRCRRPFRSQNKAEQRHCEACQHWLYTQEEQLQSDAHRYDAVVEGLSLISKYQPRDTVKPAQHNGNGRRESTDVPVAFVRLTREQIEKEYPPERIEQLCQQAQANRTTETVLPYRSPR